MRLGRQRRSGCCAGIRTGMVKALADKADRTASEKLAPVIVFARRLNDDSSTVTQSDIATVRSAGWNDQTIEDVVGLVASLKVYSILANGLGFEALSDATFAEMGAATVNMNGYTPLFSAFAAE